MSYYYSASKGAFYHSDIVSAGAMPADKVAVSDETYKSLMDAQNAGEMIRPGAGGMPEAVAQVGANATGIVHELTAATASKLGHVKIGSGVAVAGDGTISVDQGGKRDHTESVVNADLNKLLEDKTYSCSGTLKNTPISCTFCIVESFDTGAPVSGNILQVCYVPQPDNTVRAFWRNCVNGATFGKWKESESVKKVNGIGPDASGNVVIPNATTSKFGLVRLAAEQDVLNEAPQTAVCAQLIYEINEFRRKLTAYKVGDKVDCAFQYERFLECTKAGTTSKDLLDTRNVTHGQVITDGTVQWTVRTHVRSINNAVADANGNISPSQTGCLPITGGTVTGNTVIKAGFGVNSSIPSTHLVNSDVTKGEVPSTDKFFLLTALPSNGTDIAHRIGVLQFGQRSNGNVDAKLVACQNVVGGKSAEISVTYPDSGEPYAKAPTPPSGSRGEEIVTAKWGKEHYLNLDGSNDLTAENLYWSLPYKLENGATGTLRKRVIRSNANSNLGGLFAIEGMGGMTVVGAGESVNSFLTNMAADYPTWNHDSESLVLTSDSYITLITGANTWSDRSTFRLIQQGFDRVLDGVTKGKQPSVDKFTHQFLNESAGVSTINRFSGWEGWVKKDGSTGACFRVYKNVADSDENVSLLVGYDASGKAYTFAPTPDANANDSNIANTYWVQRLVSGVDAVESKLLGNNGYIKFKSGLVYIWGRDGGSGDHRTITKPIECTTLLAVFCDLVYSNVSEHGGAWRVDLTTRTTDTFKIPGSAGAIGYFIIGKV